MYTLAVVLLTLVIAAFGAWSSVQRSHEMSQFSGCGLTASPKDRIAGQRRGTAGPER